MGLVRLGKMYLRWCASCNLPILEDVECGICRSATLPVQMTPPGDVRPAFRKDLDLISATIDSQYGPGCGALLLPADKIVLMNKIPGLDRMDEVIADGEVVGTLRYDLGKGYVFLSRMAAARAIQSHISRGFVISDDGAIEFILKGLNLMAPGVIDSHPEVQKGDEVIVLTTERLALCTGTARMSAHQIKTLGKGMAVKSRWFAAPEGTRPVGPSQDWDAVVRANRSMLDRRVQEAARFIKKTMESYKLPTIVSFSGGKDSLACLLLTLDAGLHLPVFFIDTGLELPETIEHVKQTAARHGSELIIEPAPEDAFFGNLQYFGPPGRDYRWCCKTNKLGPTVRAIMKHYPGGVLSFIGQRRYESEQRAEKPKIWKNPWTPGQVGASPIQEWTALHVWLYIFSKHEPYNPWYERGLDRIGCFLCPASDAAELKLVAMQSPRYEEWQNWLSDYAKRNGLPDAWSDFALWRWRRLPDSIRKDLEERGITVGELRASGSDSASRSKPLTLKIQSGFAPCTAGFSVEGSFDRHLKLARAAEMLNIVGPVVLNAEEGWCLVADVRLFEEGAMVAKGKEQERIRKNVERVRRAVVKAEECVGCGVCIARCNEGALMLEQGRIRLDPVRCIHCGECMEPCPAVSFGDSAFEL